jgi:hypothetical protein
VCVCVCVCVCRSPSPTLGQTVGGNAMRGNACEACHRLHAARRRYDSSLQHVASRCPIALCRRRCARQHTAGSAGVTLCLGRVHERKRRHPELQRFAVLQARQAAASRRSRRGGRAIRWLGDHTAAARLLSAMTHMTHATCTSFTDDARTGVVPSGGKCKPRLVAAERLHP